MDSCPFGITSKCNNRQKERNSITNNLIWDLSKTQLICDSTVPLIKGSHRLYKLNPLTKPNYDLGLTQLLVREVEVHLEGITKPIAKDYFFSLDKTYAPLVLIKGPEAVYK